MTTHHRTTAGLLAMALTASLVACGEPAPSPDEGPTTAVSTGALQGSVILAGASRHDGTIVTVPDTGLSGVTGSDGRYLLPALPPGQYRVTASHPGYRPLDSGPGAVTVTAGDTAELPAATLVPAVGTIRGQVDLADRASDEGATVRLVGADRETTSAADGSYAFADVAPGLYAVRAGAQGYEDAVSDSFPLPDDGAVEVPALVLEPARGRLEGLALLEGQDDHGGTLVTLAGTPYAEVTGPSGAYRVEGLPAGQYTVVATHFGFATSQATDVTVAGDGVTEAPLLELASNPGAVVGVVRLEEGADLAGTRVELPGTGAEAHTDADGSFAIPAVAPGTYALRATRAGFAATSSEPFDIAPGARVDVGELTLRVARGNLQGLAQLAGATEHDGILVSLPGTPFAAVTGPAGEYALRGIPVGQYTVAAQRAGYATATVADVAVQEDRITEVDTLVLATDPGVVQGEARLEGATDHAGIQVTLAGTGLGARTESDGSFEIAGVAAGTYVVTAAHDGFVTARSTPLLVPPGGEAAAEPLRLAIARGGLAGRALLAGATDHAGTLVELDGTSFATFTASSGQYAFAGVPVGQYTVRATHVGYTAAAATDQTVTADAATDVADLSLATDPGSVTGTVTLEGNAAPGGVTVALDGTGLEALTDADGTYRIDGATAGDHTATAIREGFDPAQSLRFRVDPGGTTEVPGLALRRSRGRVEGVAARADDESHEGITVELLGTALAATTDREGRYALWDVVAGTYSLRFRSAGCAAVTLAGQVVPGNGTLAVEAVELVRLPGALTGAVRKEGVVADGDHSGVEVLVNGSDRQGASDATGAWRVDGIPPGRYTVTWQTPGHVSQTSAPLEVVAGATLDLGLVELTRLRGPVAGYARLEGQDDHTGTLVTLDGTPFQTTTGPDGRFLFSVPVGNYTGVRASRPPYFGEASLDETFTVTEEGVANLPLLTLPALRNDVVGTVSVWGGRDPSGVTVHLEGTGPATTGELRDATPTAAGDYAFRALPLGPYRVTLSYRDGWETWYHDLDLGPGPAYRVPAKELRERFLSVANDDAWTNTRDVTLQLGASDALWMCLSNDAPGACAAEADWQPFATRTDWTLSPGDGTKRVYAAFRDGAGVVSTPLSDAIELDAEAAIASFTHDAADGRLERGDWLHLELVVAEPAPGDAAAELTGYEADIPLELVADAALPAGQWRYTADYRIEGPLDRPAPGATVRAHFVDWLDNEGTATAGAVVIAAAPRIADLTIVPDSATGTAVVTWTTDEPATGRVTWGEDNGYGQTVYPVPNAAVAAQTVTLSGLEPSTEYHLRVWAADAAGNEGFSVDQQFWLRPNPPTMVVALPGVARFDVRWEAPPQEDLAGYNVYRSDSGGPFERVSGDVPYRSDGLVFHDLTAQNGTTYAYVVRAVDTFGNESADSEAVSGTPDVANGPTEIHGVLTGANVWTNRHSPYVVTADTLLEADASLVIGPGVRVEFNGFYFLRAEGQIVAVGSSDERVIVTSAKAVPESSDWCSLWIREGRERSRIDMNNDIYYGGNLLYFTTIQYAGCGAISLDQTGIAIFDSSVEDSHMVQELVSGGGAGGIISRDSDTLLVRGVIARNSVSQSINANSAGGLLASGGTVRVLYSRFMENQRTGSGAAAILSTAGIQVIKSEIENNVGLGSWGGMSINSGSQRSLLYEVRFVGNRPGSVGIAGNGVLLIASSFFDGCQYSTPAVQATVSTTWNMGGAIGIQSCEFLNDATSPCYDLHVKSHDSQDVSRRVPIMVAGNHFAGILIGDVYNITLNGNSAVGTYAARAIEISSIEAYDVDATENYWGAESTAEMDAAGPDANISGIWDYYDDFDLPRVDYSGWARSAYPLARIDAPLWGRRFRAGRPVTFEGHADDIEDGPVPPESLAWESSLDGYLGLGATLTVSDLSVGHHEVWLTATDSLGQEGKVWVEIDVTE